ncbi:hypothetical protein L0Z36_05375 [Burkholderia multivorans]|uniref:hypothetical protein n=1 Tax=Burkholderia multivorans TaxID=87883 RepID=UPI00143E2440|nr:hypothetical protein [Burkholderia multivorans]QIX17193.1 hypothetical protein FOB32_16405 [Burkholderia multivorans]UQP01365.1 hypothetical protein L0Z36_05375 [Burkholderia multivorans]
MLHHPTTERASEFWSDRQQREYDDAIDAEEVAIERASEEVEFDDVIEAIYDLPESFRNRVFTAYLDKSDRKHFVYLLELLFDDAFAAAAEGIAKRKGY